MTFQEKQKFNQPWLQALMVLVMLSILSPFLFVWDQVKNSGFNFWFTVGLAVFTFLFIIFLFFVLELKTRIDDSGIHYRYTPVMTNEKNYLWEDIEECYITTYRPFRDFGGWGFRYNPDKGKAINVRGNIGIQIVLKNGNKVLIGTQKQDEAERIIQHYGGSGNILN